MSAGLTEDNPMYPGRTASQGLDAQTRFTPEGLNEDTYKPVEDKYRTIDPGTWEYKLATTSPTGYASARVAGDIIPFGWTLFSEARKEFENMSVGEKTLDIALDLAVVLPVTKLFKGAKSLLQTQKAGSWIGARIRPGLESLSVAEKSIPIGSQFESMPLLEKVKTAWKLSDDEAVALLKKNASPWERLGRSGALTPLEVGKKFKARFTPAGAMTKKTKKALDYWITTPEGVQRADHYRKLWKKTIHAQTGKNIKLEEIFRLQVKGLLGEEAAGKYVLDKASDRLMSNIFAKSLDQPGSVTKLLDAGYQWVMPIITVPTRKVFGAGEALYGTNKIFGNIKGFLARTNNYSLQQMFNFEKRLVDAGLATYKYAGKGASKTLVGIKRGKALTKERSAQYGKVAREMDNLTAKGASEQVIATYINNNADDVVRKLLFDVHKPFLDDLYKDYALLKIPQLITESKLTSRGAAEFKRMWEGETGLASKISSLFSPKYDPAGMSKNTLMQTFLKEVRDTVRADWFEPLAKKQMMKKLETLHKGLTPTKGKQIGFPNYLENYTTRIGVNKLNMSKLKASALGTKHAKFAQTRTLEEASESSTDIFRIIESRIADQAKSLFFNPYLPKELAKISELPEGYRRFFDHWLARMTGETVWADKAAAQWLTAGTGKAMKLFGKPEVWTQQRITGLARKVNDLVYLGGLGFKPFGAIRDSFQSLLLVPTDMGGIKDIYWFLRGYKRGMNKGTQEYIKGIGAIADYTEEMALTKTLPRFGTKLGPVQLATLAEVRDVGMWMFKRADRFNRFTTGGAVLEKWEAMAAKYMQPGVKYNPKKFAAKMNFWGRETWVRRELEEMMARLPKRPGSAKEVDGVLNHVRDKFVADVIADTQFLYGAIEAPIIAGRWGVISKTGVIYQSWWMNYANLLGKWFLRTGNVSQKVGGAFSLMVSSAMTGELMVHGAGFKGKQAMTSTFGGPFPTEVSSFMVPPTWAPFYNALGVVGNLAKLDPEGAKKRFKALGRSTVIFAPGGLQLAKSYRGIKEDGFEGLARSITNYYGGTGERFLIGR